MNLVDRYMPIQSKYIDMLIMLLIPHIDTLSDAEIQWIIDVYHGVGDVYPYPYNNIIGHWEYPLYCTTPTYQDKEGDVPCAYEHRGGQGNAMIYKQGNNLIIDWEDQK
jgi:hypothetical protein